MRLISNAPATPTARVVRVALDGTRFDYRAGQAASLALHGADPTPYSIASAPVETAANGWLEFLIKVDGASRFGARVAGLAPETRISLGQASGAFVLPERANGPLLFVGGGTGIAPLRSMIVEALHRGHPGPLSLLYSARTRQEFAYLDELRRLAETGRLSLTLTLTGQDEDWTHARGRAGAAHLADLVSNGTMAFLCGPRSMVAELSDTLGSLGVGRDRICTENW